MIDTRTVEVSKRIDPADVLAGRQLGQVAGDPADVLAGPQLGQLAGDLAEVFVRFRPGDLLPGIADPLQMGFPSPTGTGWIVPEPGPEGYKQALAHLLKSEFPNLKTSKGRGIVYVGGGRYWPMIVIGLRMARLYTDLPIQVWHSGPGEPVNLQDIADIPNIGVHSVLDIGYPVRRIGGWENKTTALLNCGFSQALYLDADAYLVADPEPLFEAAEKSRFCFWADLPWNDGTVRWEASGVSNTGRVPPVQGGQLAINLGAFRRELILSHWINQHSEYFYRHQYGDQDSWRVALAATGGQYHVLGAAGWQPPAFVCRYPEPFIVHRCQAKLWGDQQVNFAHDLPGEGKVREFYNNQVIGRGSAAEVFARIYKIGMWGGAESSGDGSNQGESKPWVDIVTTLCHLAGWKKIVDLASGDGRVTKLLPAGDLVGVEVYGPHVARLRAECPRVCWLHFDIDQQRESLPTGDVALLKDVLQHWPNKLVREWLTWARSCGKWKYVLICGDCQQATDDGDCILGGYRPLDIAGRQLVNLGLSSVSTFLHKSVLLMTCDPSSADSID